VRACVCACVRACVRVFFFAPFCFVFAFRTLCDLVRQIVPTSVTRPRARATKPTRSLYTIRAEYSASHPGGSRSTFLSLLSFSCEIRFSLSREPREARTTRSGELIGKRQAPFRIDSRSRAGRFARARWTESETIVDYLRGDHLGHLA